MQNRRYPYMCEIFVGKKHTNLVKDSEKIQMSG